MSVDSAFVDIGKVTFTVKSSLGKLSVTNWGPDDISIEAQPGNDGNVFNVQYGATGQILASRDYTHTNWTVTIRPLRFSRDYARLTYLAEKIIDKNSTEGFITVEINNGNDVSGYNENLFSSQALLVNIPGFQYGKNVNGDYPLTFVLSDAVYLSGGYNDHSDNDSDSPDPMPDRSEA